MLPGKRPLIIIFGGQYHGESTYMTAGASSELFNASSGRAQFGSGLVMAPYPNRFTEINEYALPL